MHSVDNKQIQDEIRTYLVGSNITCIKYFKELLY